MVGKFPEFSRFPCFLFKKVPSPRFSRFSLSCTNPDMVSLAIMIMAEEKNTLSQLDENNSQQVLAKFQYRVKLTTDCLPFKLLEISAGT